MWRTDSFEKTLTLRMIEGGSRRGWQRMRWLDDIHWLNGHEFEWALGVGDGQGGLACCDSWGHKELDMTERLNWTELNRDNQVYRLGILIILILGYSLPSSSTQFPATTCPWSCPASQCKRRSLCSLRVSPLFILWIPSLSSGILPYLLPLLFFMFNLFYFLFLVSFL